MKKVFIFIGTVACINGAFHVHFALAEPKGEAYLDSPEMCLDTPRIKENIILDDQTVLFKTLGSGVYIKRRKDVLLDELVTAGAFKEGFQATNRSDIKQPLRPNNRVVSMNSMLTRLNPSARLHL